MSLKFLILTLFLAVNFPSLAQKMAVVSYSECEGSINIFKSNIYDLQFIGSKGKSNKFNQYSALSKITSGNQIWFSFIAPADGEISLSLKSEMVGMSLLVFDSGKENACSEINTGNAEIVRLVAPQKSTEIGLSKEVSDNFLYPVPISEGSVLHFVLIADQDISDKVKLDFKFTAESKSFTEFESKIVDNKTNPFSPSFIIRIRDLETSNPLISRVVIKGMKTYDGIYEASDMLFEIPRQGKVDIMVEHEGYFFFDTLQIPLHANKTNEVYINMEPVRSGKSIQIEEIEFVPGTSEITESSLPKLRRLRDFLALNSNVHIEIQGHVFDIGGNTLAGQKMSEARAKRVMKFLIDNGIAKERLSAVGYGNTKPIYAFPKTHSEEQANRRVEIKIK